MAATLKKATPAVLLLAVTTAAVYVPGYLMLHQRETFGAATVALALAVLAPPFAIGLLARRPWMSLVPFLSYLAAVLLLLPYPRLLAENELGEFLSMLVLRFWIPVGWGGIAVAFFLGRGVRLLTDTKRSPH